MLKSRIKEVMEQKGVTIRQLVSITGLSSGTLHRARGGLIGRCTLDTLNFIAGAMDVKVKDLFTEG